MPDFGKALRQIGARLPHPLPVGEGGPEGPGEGSNIRNQLQYLRSQLRRPQLIVLPDGEIQSTPLGSHYVVRESYPHDHFHGKIRLSRFSTPDLEILITLMREKATVPERDRILFLDTETTGMQGGTGMCPFLVGLGYFEGDEFQMLQYFIRDFDEEPSMLLALAEFAGRFQLVVTYNGAAFDLPLLETRFTLARLDNPFAGMNHFDLLFSARRLWRNGHGSCKLTALERELLSFFRGPDVPGAMIPRAYFDFLQQRPSLTLRGVFTHNIHDVVSLAALTLHACDRVTAEPASLDDPLDLFSLARIFENTADWPRALRLYEMAMAGGLPGEFRQKALENLSTLCRRLGDHERSQVICAELMSFPAFSLPGYEGAAIYLERVTGDLDAAVRVIQEGMSRLTECPEKKRWKILLNARWERLQQKVIRFSP